MPKKLQKAPNSSGGDGSTDSPPTQTNSQGKCAKTWILTVKGEHASNSSIASWLKENCSSAVWQLEKGQSGYLHYQITMTLKVKQRLTWLKNHFCRDAHCEIVNNHAAAFDYTQKSDTRVSGPFYWPAQITTAKDPLYGKILHDWQRKVINIIETEPDDRTINWFWEPHGAAGKSALCKHLVLKYDAVLLGGRSMDAFYSVDTPRIVVFDLTRSSNQTSNPAFYETLESIKNGLLFSAKYESKAKIFDSPHLFIFSNNEPDRSMLSEDRWNIHEIIMPPKIITIEPNIVEFE